MPNTPLALQDLFLPYIPGLNQKDIRWRGLLVYPSHKDMKDLETFENALFRSLLLYWVRKGRGYGICVYLSLVEQGEFTQPVIEQLMSLE